MRTILFFFFLIALGACQDSTKIPSNIIPRDKMENVLWDMMLADRYSAQFLLKDSLSRNIKLETLKLYEEVFQLHKISREDFIKSYKYYLNRPDITKVMFDSLSARGGRNRELLYQKTQ